MTAAQKKMLRAIAGGANPRMMIETAIVEGPRSERNCGRTMSALLRAGYLTHTAFGIAISEKGLEAAGVCEQQGGFVMIGI